MGPHALARSWKDVTAIEIKKVFEKPIPSYYWVRAVIEYIVDRFKSVYVPNEFVCIDEELLLWKDRLSFK